MKVGTDSIVLGSFASHCLGNHCASYTPENALDIGCGSGLLSLMLAQWAGGNLHVTAVEIDPPAYQQALDNVANSPWPKAVTVVHSDIKLHQSRPARGYDVVISNPPYFETLGEERRGFQGYSEQRQTARSQQSLSLETLTAELANNLSERGKGYLILPSASATIWEQAIAKSGLTIEVRLNVKAREDKPVSRVCYEIGRECDRTDNQHLTIYTKDNVYTEQYRRLCQHYYVNF
ncbi:tRNA1(Val) (adenine(37)-N6)-methyltransferase [Alteromonas facilis]|uniref:tRNA1(Val) (adenine(37)-N6)-methyltransferase n=1 Tax=Alteromonas facilis TaxID=2048004 RepID=UPI000C289E19|nr:methyltransferase [Alteromonas facilis]